MLAVVLFVTGNTWFYLHHIGPREKVRQHPEEVPNVLGDLYSPWRGSRELLLHHRDPYSAEVSSEIQIEFYGKPLTGSSDEPKDQQRFAYPVYIAFPFAPIVNVPFARVRAVAFWVLPLITIASIPVWLSFIGVRPSAFLTTVFAALAITSAPVVMGLNYQQLTLVVAAMLAVTGALLAHQRYWLAGIVLGLCSIKPQMTILLSLWLILWSLSAWRQRKGLFWGFTATMLVLLSGAELVLPRWISGFLKGLVAYRQYAYARGPLLDFYAPGVWSLMLGALMVILTAWVCWKTSRQSPDSFSFACTFCLVLVTTVFTVPAMSATFSQVLFLPAILLAWSVWPEMRRRSRRTRVACSGFWGAILLPWPLAVAVVLVWWLLPAAALHRVWGVPLYAGLSLPFATLGLVVFMLNDVFSEVQGAPNIKAGTA